ncbi:MAG: TIGR04282 family arsenosugar biosynthesis glycosyltransferase [Oscillospiraceae bacterium]|nr:TIGR04282 family arsenosugar biosynthesis glycosyltransferase [Oscillospiraceae bacterium]
MSNNAIILFTRIPVAGKTKTRLMPLLTGEECKCLHEAFLLDVFLALQCSDFDYDVTVCYLPDGDLETLKLLLPLAHRFIPQRGESLGDKMHSAFCDIFDMGYEKCLLIGSDIPHLKTSAIKDALKILDSHDVVINPTEDGGYYLIGLKEPCAALFHLKQYGVSSVLEETISAAKCAGRKIGMGYTMFDIDEPCDLERLNRTLKHEHPDIAPETKKLLTILENEERI